MWSSSERDGIPGTAPDIWNNGMKEKWAKFYKKFKKWRSWDELAETVEICEGIAIDESMYDIHENRLWTLVLKGIIVYFLCMGGMGSYLTAIGCKYSDITLNIIIFTTAVLCAVLYHSYKVENLGYLIFFIIFAALIYLFRNYINSGFYAVVNDTISEATDYLKMEGMQEYNERISNRYLAITISMSFIGVVANILLNNYISRRMRYIVGLVISGSMLLVPLYIEHEPSTIYTIMLVAGILMSYFYRGGGHYKLHRSESVMGENLVGVGYNTNSGIVREMMIVAAGLAFLIVSIITVIFPKDRYDSMHRDYIYKTNTSEYMTSFLAYGVMGLLNFYPNNGGLNSGELGGVSAVHLDFMTDLTVWYAPFSYDTLYIRNFVGRTYRPYKNYWEQEKAADEARPMYTEETEALKAAFEAEGKASAKARFRVKNVEAPYLPYVPYYSEDDNEPIAYGMTSEYTFYPRLVGNDTKVPTKKVPKVSYTGDGELVTKLGGYTVYISEDGAYSFDDRVKESEIGEVEKKVRKLTEEEYIDPMYLYVPKDNYEVIADFCNEAGFGGTDEEIIEQVDNYFEVNIPYTIRPGATPRKQDFVNHFLTKGKKGYCSYFASSAVLIFRYYGIPARYVEGYAVSYDDMARGELAEDEKYEDFYEGYSELGETGVVEVDVSDVSAHAWVEVYDKDYGWTIVEVTPPGSEEDTVDFWSNFQRAFSDGDVDTEADPGNGGINLSINDSVMRKIIYVIFCLIGLFVLAVLVRLMMPWVKYNIAYGKAGLNDKLIMEYSRRMKWLSHRDKDLAACVNYRSRIDYLIKTGRVTLDERDTERYIDIMERAGFSKSEISIEDYEYARGINTQMGRRG